MKIASEADAARQFDTVLAGVVANPESDTVHEAVAIAPVGARSGAVTAITQMVKRYEGGEVRVRCHRYSGGIRSMLPREKDLPLHVRKATDAAGPLWTE